MQQVLQHRVPYFFFFNDTATTEIYTLSPHDALPIYEHAGDRRGLRADQGRPVSPHKDQGSAAPRDRKSTRLNSSHLVISYAVFCLKKKIKELHVLHTRLTIYARVDSLCLHCHALSST